MERIKTLLDLATCRSLTCVMFLPKFSTSSAGQVPSIEDVEDEWSSALGQHDDQLRFINAINVAITKVVLKLSNCTFQIPRTCNKCLGKRNFSFDPLRKCFVLKTKQVFAKRNKCLENHNTCLNGSKQVFGVWQTTGDAAWHRNTCDMHRKALDHTGHIWDATAAVSHLGEHALHRHLRAQLRPLRLNVSGCRYEARSIHGSHRQVMPIRGPSSTACKPVVLWNLN